MSKKTITLYGIKNCDTVKKARTWLDKNHIDFQFHDFRSDGLSTHQVKAWLNELGWEKIINKRSTTWKTLGQSTKVILDNETAVDVIMDAPTLIKRPLLDTGSSIHVGFNIQDYEKIVSKL